VRVAGPPRQRIILFHYDPSRGSDAAGRLLDGAHVIIQSDGHYAYDHIAKQSDLIHCGCIAHARRKFFDAIKALPRDVRKQSTAAHEAVRRIDELYAIALEVGAMTDAERVAVRREKSLPLLESLPRMCKPLGQAKLSRMRTCAECSLSCRRRSRSSRSRHCGLGTLTSRMGRHRKSIAHCLRHAPCSIGRSPSCFRNPDARPG
jgi:Transposase IS66 family